LDPQLPHGTVTDEKRLLQILKNLLSNAFKFTHEGGVELAIRRATGGWNPSHTALNAARAVAAYSVTDTGIGIPADKLRVIFEAFQQADGTTSRKYGGTGLGLSISREIARLLGGEIHASSRVGEGSTFTLFLPVNAFAAGLADPTVGTVDAALAPERLAAGPAGATGATGSAVEVAFPAPSAATHDLVVAGPPVAPALLGDAGVEDDRHDLQPDDRLLLVALADAETAELAVAEARRRGFKAVVTQDADRALTALRELAPDAMVLGLDQVTAAGMPLLEAAKQSPETRHIPVHVVEPAPNGEAGIDAEADGAAAAERRRRAMQAGALAVLETPVTAETLAEGLAEMASFLDRRVRRLLVVEDDETERDAIIELIGTGDEVEVVGAESAEAAVAALDEGRFDAMVLDLKLGGTSGFTLLERLKKRADLRTLPVIVYTGQDLTRREETRLRRYAETIIVKDARSPERLLDETALFLHRVEAQMPPSRRRMIEHLRDDDAVFEGKKVLIVDDDVRNVFALTSALERHGMAVVYAENGREGIDTLEQNPDVDLVLMDIMMPEMDGYATTEAIRATTRFARLPIIALTAKAMKGDREKSIAAGASDYVTKPVDVDQLLSLMRVWLYR
ncbi:MAG TPA: response regulator, partial [Actinomycetes bacterium]|nr:response regulator [Actinomycetes bacterium]